MSMTVIRHRKIDNQIFLVTSWFQGSFFHCTYSRYTEIDGGKTLFEGQATFSDFTTAEQDAIKYWTKEIYQYLEDQDRAEEAAQIALAWARAHQSFGTDWLTN